MGLPKADRMATHTCWYGGMLGKADLIMQPICKQLGKSGVGDWGRLKARDEKL